MGTRACSGFSFRELAMDVETLEKAIKAEALKLIERYETYHNHLHLDWGRAIKRTGLKSPKIVMKPTYWSVDRKFDPFYCKSKARAIARSISRSIENGTYHPKTPFEKEIPKASGGNRTLRIYQVPDAAVSRLLYSRLLAKNKHRSVRSPTLTAMIETYTSRSKIFSLIFPENRVLSLLSLISQTSLAILLIRIFLASWTGMASCLARKTCS